MTTDTPTMELCEVCARAATTTVTHSNVDRGAHRLCDECPCPCDDTPTRTPEMGGTAKWAGSALSTSPASTSGANPDGPACPSEHRYTYPAAPKGMEPDALTRDWTAQIGMCLEDARWHATKGQHREADTLVGLANGMMRYLDLRERQEAAS